MRKVYNGFQEWLIFLSVIIFNLHIMKNYFRTIVSIFLGLFVMKTIVNQNSFQQVSLSVELSSIDSLIILE